jgi:hypothetical protein
MIIFLLGSLSAMKINSKVLSIPPYISTSWKNIASLHVENQELMLVLVVTLLTGIRIEVPHLELPTIEAIFTTHARFLEQEEKILHQKIPPKSSINFPGGHEQILSLELPLKNTLVSMEHFGTLLQHNPEQADSPDLPPDVLDKITQLSKTLGIDDPNAVPKPEPHCNCLRCQIAAAMQKGFGNEAQDQNKEEQEEIVTDEELKFRTWDVAQTGDKLYLVSNPIDTKEHYNVYLGDPVGCTCGHAHCEHISAVLNT